MMRGLSRRRCTVVSAAFTVGVLLLLAFYTGVDYDSGSMGFLPAMSEASNAFSSPHRKLLHRVPGLEEPNRMWGEKCSSSDVVISQGATSPLPSGIPTYTVEIMNACVTGCDISGIHLSCGWFSSARLINPRIFKRLGYDDCLVNDGKPLRNGGSISFQYANTFPYRLSVSTVVC